MAAPSLETVRMLLDQPRGPGMVVSCYANTAVAQGFEPHWLQPLKAEATRIRQGLADDHLARQEFDRNLERVRQAIEDPAARQAQGMAVFSAAGRDFFLAVPSPVPFSNRMLLGVQPYVVPLLEAYLRQRGYLVVLTDTHRGQLFAGGSAGVRLLDQFDEEVPQKNRSSGDRWGKNQATIARHREDHILHYHKQLADQVEKRWDEYPYDGIILLGSNDVLSAFAPLLPERLRSHQVDLAPHDWAKGRTAIEDEVRKVVDHADAAREERVLGEFTGRLAQGCAVAAGPRESIEALRNGQVLDLILGPDPGTTGDRCVDCRALFTEERADCPYCQGRCEAASLWQEMLALALDHGTRVQLVRAGTALDRHAGVAALLARDTPQWAPTATQAAGQPGPAR